MAINMVFMENRACQTDLISSFDGIKRTIAKHHYVDLELHIFKAFDLVLYDLMKKISTGVLKQ